MSDPNRETGQPRFRAEPMSVTAEMHEAYRVQRLVPEWAVPANVTIAQSVLSLLAGALIGAGLSDQVSTVSDGVVKAAVNECVKTSATCSDLTLRNAHPTLLTVGAILALVYVILQWKWNWKWMWKWMKRRPEGDA